MKRLLGLLFVIVGVVVACVASIASGANGVTWNPPEPLDTTLEATGPAGATWTPPTAQDTGGNELQVDCGQPAEPFPIKTTSVTCTASDSGGVLDTQTFNVTVVDSTAPDVTVTPPTQTLEATSASGAVAIFGATAVDNVAGTLAPTCDHASGDIFPLGTTTVTCSATDSVNTGTGSATITVQDTTAPTVTVSGVQTWTATGSSGAAVTFTASATDLVDGSIPPTCNHLSGDTFPLGPPTTVTCTATDRAGNTGSASLTVTVVDSAPTFAGVPANLVEEANGPSGTVVTYTPPSATDTVDGGLPVDCNPASGATFPLGPTTVTCSATNSSHQTATATFGVTVSDTTPPTIPVPGSITLTADGDVPATDRNIVAFLALQAHDLVDPSPNVTNDAPAVFHQGTTVVTFQAVDNSGNTSTASGVVNIVRPAAGVPPAPTPVVSTPPDRTPPGDVSDVSVRLVGKSALLHWRLPADGDFDHVEITRQSGTTSSAVRVYKGAGTTFADHRLATGIRYRYLIASYDHTGNRSTGVVALAIAPPQLLYAPGPEARVSAPVILRWRRGGGATFYNVQLYQNGKKVLSAFPGRTKLIVPSAWKYGGKTRRLAAGRYEWFVWPARGTRRKPHFAPMEGFNSFVVVPAR